MILEKSDESGNMIEVSAKDSRTIRSMLKLWLMIKITQDNAKICVKNYLHTHSS